MLVGPLESFGNNAAICSLFLKVGHLLHETVGSFEVASVKSGSVTDDDL